MGVYQRKCNRLSAGKIGIFQLKRIGQIDIRLARDGVLVEIKMKNM